MTDKDWLIPVCDKRKFLSGCAGAMIVSLLSYPVKMVCELLMLPKIVVLVGARCVLALLVALSLAYFAGNEDTGVQRTFAILTAFQFHTPFYMSRMLPNTIALVLTAIGLGAWKRKKSKMAVLILTVAAVVFRCDAIILVGLVGIHMIFAREIGLVEGILCGVQGILIGLVLSVSIDSVFWQRWLWPEGEVLWFNTILNKCVIMLIHLYYMDLTVKIVPDDVFGSYV